MNIFKNSNFFISRATPGISAILILGQKVRGTVKGFVDGGLEVKVGANLVGFIPTLFLSDVRLQHPEKKFFIGNKQELGNPRPKFETRLKYCIQ